jgi:hypothetical protein
MPHDRVSDHVPKVVWSVVRRAFALEARMVPTRGRSRPLECTEATNVRKADFRVDPPTLAQSRIWQVTSAVV